MKILAFFKLKDGVPLTQAMAYLTQEERLAWDLYRKDKLRESYMTQIEGLVVDVFEAGSVEELRQSLVDLPLLKAGMLEAQYYELRPFANWEFLFDPQNRTQYA